MAQRWPERLWVVRHGESLGNVAREAADAAGAHLIETGGRDVDVPLSPLGERQAESLGHWFRAGRPEVILCSPYLRARRTAEIIREAAGLDTAICLDERLREKEFGVLDRLTRAGIQALHPDQAALRGILGKFYHRPPGGESWCDVILRLRSALDTIVLHHAGQRVLVVAHQVVVLCLRYLLERMDEAQVLAVDAAGDVPNCGVTEYRLDPAAGPHGALALHRANWVAPLRAEGTPVTAEPERVTGAR